MQNTNATVVIPQVNLRKVMCSKQARIFFACAMHESPILEDLLDMGLLLPQTHSFFLKREVNNRKAVKLRTLVWGVTQREYGP